MTNETPTGLSVPDRARKSKTHSLASKASVARVLVSLGALVGLWILSSCSGGQSTHATAPRCADLVAHAFASPNAVVVGSYACLNAAQQAAVALGQPPVTDDQTFEVFAASAPSFDHYAYWGHGVSSGSYYFNLTGSAGPGCLRLHLDSAGLVDAGGFQLGACPKLRTS